MGWMRHSFLWTGLALMASLAAGCSKPEVADTRPDVERRLTALRSLYFEYVQSTGSPNAQGFKEFVKNASDNQRLGIPAEDLFLSPRDKQPFVINYNVKAVAGPSTGDNPGQSPILAREKTGQGGKVWLVFATGILDEMEASQLKP